MRAILALLALPWLTAAIAADPPARPFATVDATPIAAEEFEAALQAGARQKFFHGKPPEGAVDALMREVALRLIDRVLLLEAAAKRGLEADPARVEQALAGYEQRYRDSARWREQRERLLPGLRARLQEQDLLEQLEASVRQVPAVTPAQARAWYDDHPERFTEPEKLRLAVILLKLDPSAPKAAWDQAEAEAQRIRARLAAGADFAELARLHSADGSSAQGGDLGYLHRGMLPEPLQAKIDSLAPGSLSEPTRILEGVALFRLAERQPASRRSFEQSAARAQELAQRERAEAAWEAYRSRLRAQARIQIDTQRYPALNALAHAR